MNELESFVGRTFIRALREADADPDAAIRRLQTLGSPHREIAERLAQRFEARAPDGARASGIDPVGQAAASVRIARGHGGRLTEVFWLVLERNLASQIELTGSLARASRRSQLITFVTALFAVLVTGTYLFFVLPQMERLFTVMQAELPAFTRAILTGPSPWLLIAALGAAAAFAAFTLVEPGWLGDANEGGSRFSAALRRALAGGGAARDARALCFVEHAAALLAAGLDARAALAAASRAAGIYETIDFRSTESRFGNDALPGMLLAAERLGHLEQELESQHLLRLACVVTSAEQAQLRAGLVVRALLYAIVAALLIAMYLPIFKLGAAI